MQIIMFNSGFSQPEDKGILLKDIIEGGTIDREFVDRDKSYCIDANYHKGGNPKSYFESSRRQLVFPDKETCESLRPCELREPMSFREWSETLKPGTREFEFEDIAEAKYALYCDDWYNKKSLCHHVATATDIKGNQAIKRVYAETGKCPTLTTMQGGHQEPKVLMKQTPRGYNKGFERETDKTGTVSSCSWEQNNKVSTDGGAKYRKLTPRECMRLQGFTEEIIDKLLSASISNSQLYKMTGNSFTLPVIIHNLQCLLDTGWPNA